jgi:uncharacterized protein involved in outer membrane biogenesis
MIEGMRRVLLIVGIGAALLGAALFALPYLVNADQFRPLLKTELEKSLKRPVELGKLSLSVFPLALEAHDVVIGEDPAFGKERPFAKAETLAVRIDLLPLLKQQVSVDSLRITNPAVELIRNANGRWNTDSLTSDDGSKSTLKLSEVRIDDGRVALTTPTHPRAEYSNIDVSLRDYGSGGKSPLTATVRMPGNQGEISFDGTVAGSDVAGDVAMKDCALPALEAALGRPIFGKTKAEGTLSGEAKITSGSKAWSAAGNLNLQSKTHGHVTATYKADSQGDLVRVEQLDAKLGSLALRLNGTIDGDKLALKLNAADAPITELAKLASGFGVAFAPGMDVQGTVGADLTISGTTAAPAFNGQVRAARLVMKGGDLKQPVSTPSLRVDLTPDQLRAAPFDVETGDTKLHGSFSLSQYSSAKPQLDASVTVPPSDLGDLIDIAQAYGVEAARGVKATGTAAIEAKVFGSLAKGSALQYRGTGSITGATINTPALTKPVNLRTAKLRFEGESAGVESLDATVGGTTLSGRLASRADSLDFALAADKLDVDELRTLMAPSDAKSKEPSSLKGHGTLAVGSLKMDRLLLTNVRATVNMAGGQIRLDPLTASVYGGTHTGTILVDQRGALPVYTLDSKLDKIDSAQLLEAVSSLKQLVGGPLSATAKLTLSPKPNEDMIKSLDGSLGFRFTEGKLYSMNLLGEIGNLAQFLKKASPEKFTSFLAFTGDLKLANGVANTDNMKLDLNNASITMAGLMNLVDQSLDLKLRTLLNKKLADEVGGSKIGGFMTVAVGGPNGDMTIPSLLTGTFAKPRFAPDTAAIAKLKMQTVLPGLSKDPKSVVEAVSGGKEGVKGLVDLFKGKKKEPPKQ